MIEKMTKYELSVQLDNNATILADQPKMALSFSVCRTFVSVL